MGAWRWVGDGALLRAFTGPMPEANAAARALARRVVAYEEVADAVPGAASLLVCLRRGAEPSAALRADLESLTDAAEHDGERPGTLHEIDVVYDGEDLGEVARLAGIAPEEVVRLHASASYTVAFVGFSPGFGYLLGLPEALHTPRLSSPRTRVPAGSVAIGGEWTAVYPSATPGGWRLIGRSGATLFDAPRDPPALLRPGDRVRFVPR